jgi:heme O synthase-like polyprenyltransferase
MERKKLESAAANYVALRGLFWIPLGTLCILAALGNWQWGPLRHAWLFIGAVLVVAAACLPINRFYNENYGRITPSTRQQLRGLVATIISVAVMIAGSFLLRSRASWSLDLPVNPIAASFGLLMLASYAIVVGLRTHHVVIWGGLLVAGLLPVWDGADPSNIGLVLAGLAGMTNGIFDHRLLVRAFVSSEQRRAVENGDVGA